MCQTTHGIEKTIAIEFLLLEFSLIIYSSDVVFFPSTKKTGIFQRYEKQIHFIIQYKRFLTYNLKYVHF